MWTASQSNRSWYSITSSADGSKLAAVGIGTQIYTSTNSGETWTAQESSRGWLSITSSADGSKLAAVALGGQIYTSTNSGETWTARDSNRNWYSITSSADGSKLAAVVLGGQIYTSTNSGVTWTARASYQGWRSITSSADGSKLAAVAGGGQIYTSTNSGVDWTARERQRGWRSVTSSADGSKLAAVTEQGQIYTSTDSGETWTARESKRAWSSITSSSDGNKLAAVAGGGQIYTSTDSGVTWTARESSRYWKSITSSADGSKLAAVADGGQIYTSIPPAPVLTYAAPTSPYTASFSFRVQDSANTDNLDPSPNTLTFKIENAPLIIEPTSASITATTATLGANVTSGGDFDITERGVVYSLSHTNEDPVIGGSGVNQVIVTGTTGVFIAGITSLTRDTSYSFKAYATNSIGTTYTSVATFTTRATPPEGVDKTFSVQSHGITTFESTDWGFTDTDASPHGFAAVKITSLPIIGMLKIDGVNATVGQVVSVKPIEVGMAWTERESHRWWLSITSSADGSKLAALVFGGQIYTSTESGVTWTARASNRYWESITSSADGSKLATVDSGWGAGGQIYTSTNSGVTWTARASKRKWKSIMSSADGSKLAAVVYGGQIYTSTSSGVTWTARASNRNWVSITTSTDGSKLAAVDNGSGAGGRIYTSMDSGVTWTAQENDRSWRSIVSSADGNKLAAVVYEGHIYTSTDSGMNWTARATDAPREWCSISSSGDGSKLVALEARGHIYTSIDSGVTWTARATDENRSWVSITSSADSTKLAAVTWDGQIYTSAPAPAPVITYTAPAGTGTASFTFQVQDSASADNLDLSPNTMSFDFDSNAPLTDGPLVRNPKIGLFEQNVTVTNNLIGVTMPGFRLIVTNLPNGIDFTNKTHPFLPVIDSLADLAPGGSRVVKVSFRINDKNLQTWQPNYQVISLDASQRDLVTNASGSYAGLVQRGENVHLSANPNLGGRIDMTMSTTGAVTGTITEGVTKFPFVTKLSLDPASLASLYFKVALPKSDKSLEIIFDHPNAVFTGTLSHSASPEIPEAEVKGLRKVWTATRTAASYAGRHNYAIINPYTDEGPQGLGFGSYTITGSTGSFVRAGKLADGSTITGSGFVGADGQVFVYQPLYANRGSAMGFQQIQLGLTLAERTLSGEMDWFKPAPASVKSTDLIYRDGFGPLTLACAGADYTAPSKNHIALGLGLSAVYLDIVNAEIRFRQGGLETEMAEFQTPLQINSKNAVRPLGPNLEKMKINKFDVNTGLFTGSFILPAQGTVPARTVTFEGQISYDEAADRELGHGFFLMPQIPVPPQKISTSPRLSGSVRIVPAG